MNHAEIVTRAARWLRNGVIPDFYHCQKPSRVGCAVVLTEFVGGGSSEIPDAIGWAYGGRLSILIECKASRADFLRDQRKSHRRYSDGLCLGQYRYYMAPVGLIGFDEMPDGWGLLEIDGRRVVVSRIALKRERNAAREMGMLWSQCRKLMTA